MLQKLGGEAVCCGIDWITVTQRPCAEMELLREQAFALAAVELSSGNFGKPWAALGYEGFSVGGVFYGERYDGCILQLTGPTAASHWQRAYENSCSVTRLDLQVTFRTTEDPRTVIRRHYAEIRKRSKKLAKPPKFRLLVDCAESYTVYSGAPSSDRFGRIYDKGRESGQKALAGCVRYELVLRKKRAKAAASQLSSQKRTNLTIALNALAFFSSRGCSVQSLNAILGGSATMVALYCCANIPDIDRRLVWLRTQVRPSVIDCVQRLGEPAVKELLGLH